MEKVDVDELHNPANVPNVRQLGVRARRTRMHLLAVDLPTHPTVAFSRPLAL